MTIYYGGAPFAARAIYQEAQADVRHLSPVAHAGAAARRHPRLPRSGGRRAHRRRRWPSPCSWSSAAWAGGARSSPSPARRCRSSCSPRAAPTRCTCSGAITCCAPERSAAEAIDESLRIVGPPLAIAAGDHRRRLLLASSPPTCVRCARSASPAAPACCLCWLTSLTLVPGGGRALSAQVAARGAARRASATRSSPVALGAAPPPLLFVGAAGARCRSPSGRCCACACAWSRARSSASAPSRGSPSASSISTSAAPPSRRSGSTGDFDDPSTLRELGRLRGFHALAAGRHAGAVGAVAADAGDERAWTAPPCCRGSAARPRTCTCSSRGGPASVSSSRASATTCSCRCACAATPPRRWPRSRGSRAPACAASRARRPSTTSPSGCRGRRAPTAGWCGRASSCARSAPWPRPGRSTKSGRAAAPRSSTDYLSGEEAPPMSAAARADIARLAIANPEGSPQLQAALLKVAPDDGRQAYRVPHHAPRGGASPPRRRSRRAAHAARRRAAHRWTGRRLRARARAHARRRSVRAHRADRAPDAAADRARRRRAGARPRLFALGRRQPDPLAHRHRRLRPSAHARAVPLDPAGAACRCGRRF